MKFLCCNPIKRRKCTSIIFHHIYVEILSMFRCCLLKRRKSFPPLPLCLTYRFSSYSSAGLVCLFLTTKLDANCMVLSSLFDRWMKGGVEYFGNYFVKLNVYAPLWTKSQHGRLWRQPWKSEACSSQIKKLQVTSWTRTAQGYAQDFEIRWEYFYKLLSSHLNTNDYYTHSQN